MDASTLTLGHALRACLAGALLLCLQAGAAEPEPQRFALHQPGHPARLAVNATIESYQGAPRELLRTTAQASGGSDAATFLAAYYEAARKGDRNRIVASFDEKILPAVQRRYADDAAIREEFASVTRVELEAILFWNDYRLAVLSHWAKVDGKEKPFDVAYLMHCQQRQCRFIDNQRLMQAGSTLLSAFIAGGKPAPLAKDGTQLVLAADAVESAAAKEKLAYPVTLQLAPASAAVAAQIAALTAKVGALFPQPDKKRLEEQFKPYYSAGTPSQVQIYRGDAPMVMYDFAAYAGWYERQLPWRVAAVYEVDENVKLAILQSEKTRALLPQLLVQGRAGWTYVTEPSRYPVWDVAVSGAFQQALAARLAASNK
ncbi:hypothetical protein [Pseudoduganella violacea]|uniref:DUF2066 domain-containing protein n=1 Tax=Pseudoduganella violacea TaxID=1715466 RepID=A0A7W5FWZ6_9BURK|nr:hypothetical protein [Pseudoduganella violacea]MBB3122419.1 hypothetical protein [Pseudoduganella violacea]